MQNQKMRKLVEKIVRQRIKLLNENDELTQPAPEMSKEEFMEAVKRYSTYKESINRSGNLKKMVAEIGKLVNSAQTITLAETGEWFDEITVNRHMKQLQEAYKVLEKTCNELVQSQQRFESAYNDIGRVLENYYDI